MFVCLFACLFVCLFACLFDLKSFSGVILGSQGRQGAGAGAGILVRSATREQSTLAQPTMSGSISSSLRRQARGAGLVA